MRMKPSISLADAQPMIAAARAEAERQGWLVSIAVVDESGVLVAFERMDGANPQSADISRGKAWTAAVTRSPTKALEDVVKERPATLSFAGRVPVQGGLPIKVGADCIGGIGVSGAASKDDEQAAQAGLAALPPSKP